MPRIAYTAEAKQEIIAFALQPGCTHMAVTRKFGVTNTTLKTWLKHLEHPDQTKETKMANKVRDLELQVARLNAALAKFLLAEASMTGDANDPQQLQKALAHLAMRQMNV